MDQPFDADAHDDVEMCHRQKTSIRTEAGPEWGQAVLLLGSDQVQFEF